MSPNKISGPNVALEEDSVSLYGQHSVSSKVASLPVDKTTQVMPTLEDLARVRTVMRRVALDFSFTHTNENFNNVNFPPIRQKI